MARKKVKLVLIVKDSARKATYKKRKRGLLKKLNEISTLCGISAGAIIYSPFDPNPEVWPSADGLHQVITQFRNVPEIEREKNMFDQRKFLQQRIDKLQTLLKRQKNENKEAYLTEVMYECLVENKRVAEINPWDLNDLAFVINQFINSLDRRIEILGGSDMEMGESSNAVAATDPSETVGTLTLVEGATAPANTVHGVGSSSFSAAGASLFNRMPSYPPYQPQFHQPPAGFYDQSRTQNQFMGMMNRPEGVSYPPNQIGYPFMDYNHQAPYHHHQPQQHQFFPGESSTAPQHQLYPGESSTATPPATSGSVTPATTPNPTNNFGFP